MKKFTLLLIVTAFSFSAYSQVFEDKWALLVGVNAIGNLGTQEPTTDVDDFAFNTPIAIGAEFNLMKRFSIEGAFTFNKFTEGSTVQGIRLTEDFDYIAFDSHIKYYFGELLFPKLRWLDIYATTGIGVFEIEDTKLSGNFGGGLLFWVNRTRTFGFRTQALGKFAFNPDKNTDLDNNHFQFNLQAVILLN